ncbi:transposase [Spongiactinospora rosea]|uniref:Transposase n=1 Tax=Spongiactinospora rosea TaxID=2248750 RepID=A0A366LR46_9ACTN|nr:transposase [Spongiactinospora rosea]
MPAHPAGRTAGRVRGHPHADAAGRPRRSGVGRADRRVLTPLFSQSSRSHSKVRLDVAKRLPLGRGLRALQPGSRGSS